MLAFRGSVRAWGREIAAASVRRLFEQARAQDFPSWQEEQYADWIGAGDGTAPRAGVASSGITEADIQHAKETDRHLVGCYYLSTIL